MRGPRKGWRADVRVAWTHLFNGSYSMQKVEAPGMDETPFAESVALAESASSGIHAISQPGAWARPRAGTRGREQRPIGYIGFIF